MSAVLTYLPETLVNCRNKLKIYCSYNRITQIPKSLEEHTDIKIDIIDYFWGGIKRDELNRIHNINPLKEMLDRMNKESNDNKLKSRMTHDPSIN